MFWAFMSIVARRWRFPGCQYISKDIAITHFLHNDIFSILSIYLKFDGVLIGLSRDKWKNSPSNQSIM